MRRRHLLCAPALIGPWALEGAEREVEVSPSVPSMEGAWQIRFPDNPTWQTVTVPHTWQVLPGREEYYGTAEYRKVFFAPRQWAGKVVRIEFEAVFHSAWVELNGKPVGQHLGKGYTAFTLDLTGALRLGEDNTLSVRVDNGFREQMLPRGRSSDWAHDGGIYRPVQLLVTPPIFLERIDVDAT